MDEDIFDRFLNSNGHTKSESWEKDYNKKKCPECFALHNKDAIECNVCEWNPRINM